MHKNNKSLPNQLIHKKHIIHLISNDMINYQLTHGLEKLKLKAKDHFIADNSTVVAVLMGIPEDSISNAWLDIYMEHVFSVENLEVTTGNKRFNQLAEACYGSLRGILDGGQGD